MPKTLTGKALYPLDMNWCNCKKFFLRHKTFFEICFIFLYGLEQILLILGLIFLGEYFFSIIALYTAILMTTIGVERTLMNSRFSHYKIKSSQQTQMVFELEKEIKKITKQNRELEIAYLKKR